MSTLFTAPGHGFSADDPVVFGNCYPDPTTLVEGQTYYVLATDLDADHFRVSETVGGTALTLTAELDEFVVQAAFSQYTAITDPSDVMAPPPAPDAPTALALSSSVSEDADGHQVVRLKAAFTQATNPGLAGTIIEIATTASGPDWDTATILRAPLGAAFVQAIVPGNVEYSVRAASEDVYGQTSAYTSVETHTATKDASAPATPTSLSALDGILSIGVSWAQNTEADLSYYELQVDDDPAFGSPSTTRGKITKVIVGPLGAGTYHARLRAVDTSGNMSDWTASDSADARLVDTADIDPDATIENATNLINGPATVTIDDDGLTIEDGALTLKDEFGETVLVASGFAGSWQEYFQLGLFNALLNAGTAGTIPNGRTSALPYWTLANDAGSPVATFMDPGVKVTFAAVDNIKRLTSDPFKIVASTDQPMIVIEWEWHFGAASNAQLEIEAYLEYSPDGTFAAVTEGEHVVDGVLRIIDGVDGEDRTIKVDTGALYSYARLVIEVKQLVAHSGVNYIQINNAAIRYVPYWGGDVFIGEPGASLAVTRASDPAVVVDANMLINGDVSSDSGTGTPTVNNRGTGTISGASYEWVRIGRVVFFQVDWTMTANGSGGSNVTVTGMGLPTALTNTRVMGDRGATGVTGLSGRVTNSGGEAIISIIHNLNGWAAITGADLADTATYSFHGMYIAA